ncbi:glycosyltransferase [Pediococcus ethanolidurans]|uniref:glycosyltransferase n=1 Tax=Pediococcus ethanolidurans TaxID=319653 RepID=UPI0021E805F9|nr:glycosyltransferase [Pediococcus ethanolidurans]MCV3327713.1 glycosyltransferase [Pediococcus ethanolidurans]
MTKISLVVPTYNGQKYILNFLKSIDAQKVQPDQVIFQDDGSSDDTVQIIKGFIKMNSKEWVLKINKKNLGWRLNFESLIRQAEGDVIFLADQDDFWCPDKIGKMASAFKSTKGIQVLTSNYKSDVSAGKKVSFRKIVYGNKNGNDVVQIESIPQNYYIKRPGWTFAISKKIIPQYLDLQSKCPMKAHDTLLWQLALVNGTLYHFNEVTGIWVMHDNSAMASESERKLILQKKKNIFLNYCEGEISSNKFYLEVAISVKYDQQKIVLYIKKRIIIFEKRRRLWLEPSLKNFFKCLPAYLSLWDCLADLKFLMCSVISRWHS